MSNARTRVILGYPIQKRPEDDLFTGAVEKNAS